MPTETLTMKNSNIDWIGNIPNDWGIVKFKYVSRLKTGGTPENNEGIDTENTGTGWYTPGDILEDSINLKNPLQYITPEIVKRNRIKLYPEKSVLFVGIASIGKIGYLEKESYSNQQITALIPNNNVYGKFLAYSLLAGSTYIKDNALYTVVAIVNNQSLGNYKLALPNITEQLAIADLLDEKCEKIDKVIGEIEEQIQILEDYKKSLITETVTKGLDKNVPMKDSGVDYIGKTPEKWNIIRLKHFSYMKGRIGWQGLSSDEFIDEGPYLVTGTDFENGEVQWDRCYHISQKRYNEAWQIQLKIGDLLVTKDGTIGKLAYIHSLPDNASLNSHLLLIRPLKNKYINKFLYWVLSSQLFKTYYELASTGAIMDSLSQEKIGNFSFAIPEIKEQEQIADYLDKECKKIDKTINDKKEQLEIIKEYKKSLIYEYVTGKKRVAC